MGPGWHKLVQNVLCGSTHIIRHFYKSSWVKMAFTELVQPWWANIWLLAILHGSHSLYWVCSSRLEPNRFSHEAYPLGQWASHTFCEYLSPRAVKTTRELQSYTWSCHCAIPIVNMSINPWGLEEPIDSALISHSFKWLTTISSSFYHIFPLINAISLCRVVLKQC